VLNSAGATTFGGAVGGTTALTSLTTDAAGSTSLGGNVSTSGAQVYNDVVTLAGNATLSGSGVSFASTVNGARALTINASGATTFGGVVGGTTALSSLTTDATGTTSLGRQRDTTGAQAYNDAVTLNVDAVLAGSAVGFNGSLNGARTLTVNASGATSFGGVVGGTTALTALTTDAAGSTSLGANVNTTGVQTYNDAVTLTGNATLVASAVTFNSSVDGARALTINTPGATTFGGAVGGTTALSSLTTDAAGTTSLGGNVSTAGAQTYNDPLTLSADAVLSGSAVAFSGSINGAHA